MNLFAPERGIAVREYIMKPGHGRVDYLLYVDKAVVGVIEAKPMGTPLSGVEWQSAMYATGLPDDVRRKALDPEGRLPFVFEASGTETHFTNGFDPAPRAERGEPGGRIAEAPGVARGRWRGTHPTELRSHVATPARHSGPDRRPGAESLGARRRRGARRERCP